MDVPIITRRQIGLDLESVIAKTGQRSTIARCVGHLLWAYRGIGGRCYRNKVVDAEGGTAGICEIERLWDHGLTRTIQIDLQNDLVVIVAEALVAYGSPGEMIGTHQERQKKENDESTACHSDPSFADQGAIIEMDSKYRVMPYSSASNMKIT
jgi:hypothetical protein